MNENINYDELYIIYYEVLTSSNLTLSTVDVLIISICKYIYSDTFDVFNKAAFYNDYYYCMGDYLETYNQNAFFVRNEFKNYEGIVYRDKKTGNMIGGNIPVSYKGMAFIALPKATFGNEFVSFFKPFPKYYNAFKDYPILSDADKEKAKHFKDDDNPVLVYFTLKEF